MADRTHGSAIAAHYGGTGDIVAQWNGRRQSDSVRESLRLAGIDLESTHRGVLKHRHFTAQAELEADDFVRLRSTLANDEPPRVVLERCSELPGNVRMARTGRETRLAAETRVDGAVHLPESLGEITQGFLSLLGKSARRSQDTLDVDPPEAAMRAAIDEIGWTNEQAVVTDFGWELHPRVAGASVPVQARLTSDAVLLRRAVIADLPDSPAASAVAHQALMQNERLRFCRLAISDNKLVVESLLRSALIRADWLLCSVHAVASAALAVEPELKLLLDEPAVADAYTDIFLS